MIEQGLHLLNNLAEPIPQQKDMPKNTNHKAKVHCSEKSEDAIWNM
jgi:hypothetical protein